MGNHPLPPDTLPHSASFCRPTIVKWALQTKSKFSREDSQNTGPSCQIALGYLVADAPMSCSHPENEPCMLKDVLRGIFFSGHKEALFGALCRDVNVLLFGGIPLFFFLLSAFLKMIFRFFEKSKKKGFFSFTDTATIYCSKNFGKQSVTS